MGMVLVRRVLDVLAFLSLDRCSPHGLHVVRIITSHDAKTIWHMRINEVRSLAAATLGSHHSSGKVGPDADLTEAP